MPERNGSQRVGVVINRGMGRAPLARGQGAQWAAGFVGTPPISTPSTPRRGIKVSATCWNLLVFFWWDASFS